MRITKTHIYFVGTALLTAAAANENGVTPALLVAGFAFIVYALCRRIGDN